MSTNRNLLRFKDLANLIQQWSLDTFNYEDAFRNQSAALNDWWAIILNTKEKAKFLNRQLYLLKCLELRIQCDFFHIADNITKIENLIGELEKQVDLLDQNYVLDPHRKDIYGKAEDLSTCLQNCNEVLQLVDTKINHDDAEMTNNPAFVVFKVLGENLTLLEKLSYSSEKLQDILNAIESLKQKFTRRLICQ